MAQGSSGQLDYAPGTKNKCNDEANGESKVTRAIVEHDRSSKHFDQPLFASRFNSFGSRGGVSSWDDRLHLKQASPTGPMPERVRSQELGGLLSPTPQFERAWSASLCRAREYRYARWRFAYSR